MFLITGSTGHIGRGLVEQLHKDGHDVRALVRDASRANLLPDGIDIAVGNLDDAGSVAAALRGVDSVFLLQVGPGTTQTQIMIDAARSAGVNRIVLLSSVGARLIPVAGLIPQSLTDRETLLRASGLDVTYLRPTSLMSNALSWAGGIRENNRVVDPTDPGVQVPVDPDDSARVAARVLTEDGHAGHGYILNGPEALTVREQVGILSRCPRTHHRVRRRHTRAGREGGHQARYPRPAGRSHAAAQRDVPRTPGRPDRRRRREPHRGRAGDLPPLVRAPR